MTFDERKAACRDRIASELRAFIDCEPDLTAATGLTIVDVAVEIADRALKAYGLEPSYNVRRGGELGDMMRAQIVIARPGGSTH